MQIWANTLVKNEERYIWYAVTSIIDYVDKILIWDTGSTDKTVDIIKEIQKRYADKVDFKEVGSVNVNQFTVIRQKMLERSNADWFIIVDGDEVWWDDSIAKTTSLIRDRGKDLESIINPYYSLAGDIFHFQDEKLGRYNIDTHRGHINIRATNRNVSGLHFINPHGQLALVDGNNIAIQYRNRKNRIFLNEHYLHFTNVIRSFNKSVDKNVPKRDLKLKYHVGINFPLDFYYPEVFFKPRPKIVKPVWVKRDMSYEIIARVYQPIKFLKRSLLGYGKSGY